MRLVPGMCETLDAYYAQLQDLDWVNIQKHHIVSDRTDSSKPTDITSTCGTSCQWERAAFFFRCNFVSFPRHHMF